MSNKNENLFQTTEVKLLLDETKVLNEGFNLSDNFAEVFKIKEKAADMKIWYLDTKNQSLYDEKWIVRYRYHDNCDFELTFKKRYSEEEYHHLYNSKTLKKFLKKFEPEVDLGYDEKTFSFSYVKKFALKDHFLELDLDEAKKNAIKKCPSILENWNERNWGFKNIYNSVLYGPVIAKEYKGKIEDFEVNIEIWKLKEFFAELSFDYPSDKASFKQKEIMKLLKENNWFQEDSLLKTQLLFDYYRNKRDIH